MTKPTTATTVGTIYLISNQAGLHKIGITQDWARRSRELEVGSKTTAVLTATVIRPKALELALHRRHKAERLPQTEWFRLTAKQLNEVIAVINAEAQRLKGSNADLHIRLDAVIYEAQQCDQAGDRKGWEERLDEAEQLRRQIDPEYNARAIAREQASKQAAALRRKQQAEHWNNYGWWQSALFVGTGLSAAAALPVIGLLVLPVSLYATARCGPAAPECRDAIVRPVANTLFSVAGLAVLASTAVSLRRNAKDKREVEE
jgi:predicted GIY-YIG superfamily endonuclease